MIFRNRTQGSCLFSLWILYRERGLTNEHPFLCWIDAAMRSAGWKDCKTVGFPNVTGYIVAGLIIGPHILGIISLEATEESALYPKWLLGL